VRVCIGIPGLNISRYHHDRKAGFEILRLRLRLFEHFAAIIGDWGDQLIKPQRGTLLGGQCAQIAGYFCRHVDESRVFFYA
jgi:hypothetical protein